MENVKFARLKGVFSKGLIDDVWEHNYPIEFSSRSKNVRIINNSLYVRNGYNKVFDGASVNRVYELISNWDLYAIYNRHLYSIDLDAWTATQESTSQMTDARLRSLVYGKYIMIFSGGGYPYVYDVQADSFSQLTSSNIASGSNPWLGATYANFTFVAGSGNNSNILYISRGITSANPEYSYDRSGSWSETLYLKWNIKGFAATLQRLFVFTDKTIAFLDESTLTEIGWVTVSFTKDISKDNVPVSPESIVVAQDRIFMITTDKNVKEVGRAWVNDLEVSNLSEREWQSIRRWMKRLDDDLSNTVGIYNQEENIVVRHLQTKGAGINNRTLIYDLTNDTFLVDTGKIFGCIAYHNNKLYTGGYTTAHIYEENSGNDDDGASIPRERVTSKIGDSRIVSMFKQLWLTGEHNALSTLNVDVIVDDKVVAWPYTLSGESSNSWGIWSVPIGSSPIGGENKEVLPVPFSKLQSFRYSGERIQIRLYGEKYWGVTVLNELGVWSIALRELQRSSSF